MLAGADGRRRSRAEAEGEGDEEPKREATGPIEEMLSRNQEVLVQVSKESLGHQGRRVTSFISIPGRYVVYMPQARHVGVSRRIRDERERDRLRAALRSLKLPPGGFILRTNAEGKGEEEFAHDVEFLSRLWSQIQARFEQAKSSGRAARGDGSHLPGGARSLLARGGRVRGGRPRRLRQVRGATSRRWSRRWRSGCGSTPSGAPIFDAFGIEKDIEKALRRRVWLKSGGYIVIDHTEALVSIDVNTGKYVGKRDFEQTVLKINLEAATEVVRQIRLRDLGGIIIIDFIDMEVPRAPRAGVQGREARAGRGQGAHQRAGDLRARLVEMTRKRVRQDLRALLTQSCPTCRGAGVVKSNETLATEIYRAIQAKAAAEAAAAEGREIMVRVHPDVAGYLEGDGRRATSSACRPARGEDHRPAGAGPEPARGVRSPRALTRPATGQGSVRQAGGGPGPAPALASWDHAPTVP
jgi:ribonuclease G